MVRIINANRPRLGTAIEMTAGEAIFLGMLRLRTSGGIERR
jgi:hypothetical protein